MLVNLNSQLSLQNRYPGVGVGVNKGVKVTPNEVNSNEVNPIGSNPGLAFKRINVHIVDGGNHGSNMEHFAKAIMKDVKKDVSILFYDVPVNKNDPNLKQMSTLESCLRLLNLEGTVKKGDYLAIPGLATVSLMNLQDRIRNILGRDIMLNPQNLTYNKDILLSLLKRIYDYKHNYSNEICYMDKQSQELEYVYGVIQEINKLVEKGVNVYIPAGHPEENSVKWVAGEENKKEELYRAIAKPDTTYRYEANEIIDKVKKYGWYDFNLLSLSNAHVVNVRGRDEKDYIFSSYDYFVNDGARGVFNFTPVRDAYGNIKGYSYTDETTVQYPFDEFPANESISNICRYVGFKARNLIADFKEHKLFKELVEAGKSTASLPYKLYNIFEVFSPREIEGRKLHVLGSLINNQQNLVFDTNSSGKVLFQKCNCEGSDKPSVLSMWGSCFSTLSAIKRDILKEPLNEDIYHFPKEIKSYIYTAREDERKGYLDGAEYYYNRALDLVKEPEDKKIIYLGLYRVLKTLHKVYDAKNLANSIMNMEAQEITKYEKESGNASCLTRRLNMANLYRDLSKYCALQGEGYGSDVCSWASEVLDPANYEKLGRDYADRIIERRLSGSDYIGDLYNECH